MTPEQRERQWAIVEGLMANVNACFEEIDDLIDEYCGSPNPDEMSAARVRLAEAKEELLREWSIFPENYFAPRKWDVWEIERAISLSRRFQECT